MAKTGEKVSEKTVERANEALVPGGTSNEALNILDIINGKISDLLEFTLEAGSATQSIDQYLVGSKQSTNIFYQQLPFLASIDDKLVSILAVLYGDPGANTTKKSNTYTGLIQRQGLFSQMDSIATTMKSVITATDFYDFRDELIEILSSNKTQTSSGQQAITLDASDINKQIIDTFGGLLSNFESSVEANINSFRKELPQIVIEGFTFNFDNLASNLDSLKKLVNQRIIDEKSSILDDVNKIIYSLDKELNGFVLNEGVIKDLTDLAGVLNRFSAIKEFPEHLKIDEKDNIFVSLNKALKQIGKINKKDTQNIQTYVDLVKSISSIYNIKIPKNSGEVKTYIDDIIKTAVDISQNLQVLDKNQKNSAEAIGTLLNSVIGLGSFDKNKYKDTVRTLRKIRNLTEKPTSFSELGLSNTGLIWQILNNISIAAESTKTSKKDATAVASIFEAIIDINDSIDINETKEFIKKLANLSTAFDGDHLYAVINSLSIAYLHAKKNSLTKASLEGLVGVFDFVNVINKLFGIKTVFALSIKLSLLTDAYDTLPDLWNSIIKAAKDADEVKEKLNVIHTILNSITNSDYKKIGDLNKFVESLAVLGKSLVLLQKGSKGGAKAIGKIEATISKLQKVIDAINGLKIPDKLDKKIKSVETIIKSLSLVMLIGAAVGMLAILAAPALLGFSVITGLFILTLIGSINLATKGMKDSFKNVKEFSMLILVCTGVMMLGGLFMLTMPKVVLASLGFGLALGAFMLIVVGSIKLYSKWMPDSVKNIKEFGSLIAICIATMVIGGALLMFAPKVVLNALLFGLTLGVFIFTVIGSIRLATLGMKNAFDNIKEVNKLIIVCTLTMIIGAALLMFAPKIIWNALLFGVVLGVFIFTVLGAINLATKGSKNAFNNIKAVTTLIVVSTAILMIGAWFVSDFNRALGALLFGAILGGFVWLVVKAFTGKGKNMQKALPTAIGIAILTAISAAALLIGGSIIAQDPMIGVGALMFGLILIGYVYLMGKAVKSLAKIKPKDLFMGTFVLAVIVGASFVMGKVMKDLAEAASIADPGQLLKVVGIMGLIILGFAGVIIGLGALTLTGIGAIALFAGAGILATIAGVALLSVYVIKGLAEAAVAVKKAPKLDTKKLTDMIMGITSLVPILEPLSARKVRRIIRNSRKAVNDICMMIFTISSAIQYMASLTIPEYDKDGKISGFRNLTNDDFTNAATNIKTIIETLGGAIIDTYERNPAMFKKPFLGETPFTRTVESCSAMGDMIAKIADGVKEYASLSITDPVTGKKRPLTEQDFKDAASNIKQIIETLGTAIIATYEANPTMFNKPFLGETPFALTVESCGKMGDMIGSIARGVKDYAALVIEDPITGKKRQMLPMDFVMAAININTILTVLGKAIIQTYNDNKELFTDPSAWHTDADKTPFGMTVKAMAGTGELVSTAADGVKKVYELMTGTLKDVTVEDMTDKVDKILTCVAKAIISVYYGNEKMFTDASSWHNNVEDTPFYFVRAAMDGVGTLVSECVDAIAKIYELPLTEADYKKGGKLQQILTGIMTAMPVAVIEASKSMLDPEKTEALVDQITNYKDIINTALTMYKSVWSLLDGIGATTDEKKLNLIGSAVITMMTDTNTALTKLLDENMTMETLTVQVDGFANVMKVYRTAIADVTAAYVNAPKELKKHNEMMDILTGIRLEIERTPDLTNFKEQTETVKQYVETLNNIDGEKVDKMTNLANAIANMSDRLGNLDTLTDVLSNKLSVVLSNLTDRLDESAKTIKTANKLQDDRHNKIKESLNMLKNLINKPLNVEVLHKQDADMQSTSNSGSENNDNYNGGSSNNSNTQYAANTGGGGGSVVSGGGNTYHTINIDKSNKVAGEGGISERQAREIARAEIKDALEQLAGSRNQRGSNMESEA